MNKINTTDNIRLCVIVFLLARVHTVMHKHLFPHNETLGMDISSYFQGYNTQKNVFKAQNGPWRYLHRPNKKHVKNMIRVTYLQYEVGLV